MTDRECQHLYGYHHEPYECSSEIESSEALSWDPDVQSNDWFDFCPHCGKDLKSARRTLIAESQQIRRGREEKRQRKLEQDDRIAEFGRQLGYDPRRRFVEVFDHSPTLDIFYKKK